MGQLKAYRVISKNAVVPVLAEDMFQAWEVSEIKGECYIEEYVENCWEKVAFVKLLSRTTIVIDKENRL